MSTSCGMLQINTADANLRTPKTHPWNVISEKDFKALMSDIFNQIYDALKCTVGPYGSGTMIERLGEYQMTKDGFMVLQHIHFNETSANAVLNLILTMSHQMVMKVGDGSTTTIMAAKNFLDIIAKTPVLKQVRPKDFVIQTQAYIDRLIVAIEEMRLPVTDENYLDVVDNIAYIATNGDPEYTAHIRNIYQKVGRDAQISKEFSDTAESSIDIKEDVYHIRGKYLDKTYLNTQYDTCEIENPIVVLFNFTLEDKHWPIIQALMNHLNQAAPEQRVVFIAPYYDKFMGERIAAECIKFRKFYKDDHGQSGAVPYPMVFGAAPFISKVDHYVYDDLAPYLGGEIINPVTGQEFMNSIHEYVHAMSEEQEFAQKYQMQIAEARAKGLSDEDIAKIKPLQVAKSSEEIMKDILKQFDRLVCRCERVVLGNRTIEFSGFRYQDEAMVEVHKADAAAMLDKEYAQVENSRYVHKEYIDAMERMRHLNCRSAVIKVGGKSELQRSMNNDSVDDAIKACESAVKYGYYYGNNLAIFRAIKQVTPENDVEKAIGKALWDAFGGVILTIHQNKDPNATWKEVENFINKSLETNSCYDLTSEEYNGNVINSIKTDIEILKGSISMVGTLISANQYIASQINIEREKAAKKG